MAKPSSQIYTYSAADAVYALAWSAREDKPCRFAVGSFLEQGQNYVDIVQYDGGRDEMVAQKQQRLQQDFPATKVLFLPSAATSHRDLVAASSDSLRLWVLANDAAKFDKLLDAKQTAVAPLTSFDWASFDVAKIITSSIDSSCCLWDIERGHMEMRLNVHKEAVHDVAWGAAHVFASCAADGSARIVDTRASEQPSVMFQMSGSPPPAILRIGWNKQDPRYLATLASKSSSVLIIDVRRPGAPLALSQHSAPVNAFDLSPTSAQHICTAGDDSRALIWDLQRQSGPQGLEPALSYQAASEVVALQWSALSPEHIAIAFGAQAQVLHV